MLFLYSFLIGCIIFIALLLPLRNPYKFRLYIGKKGSGKTTKMTEIALNNINRTHIFYSTEGQLSIKNRRLNKKPKYKMHCRTTKEKKQWNIYSNVDLNIPGIRLFNTEDLGKFVPEEPSIVLIDEINLIWDNRNFKNFDPATQKFFRLSRQYRCKIYGFSQTFDTDKKLRALADEIWLCTNFGLWSLIRKVDKRVTIKDSALDADSQVVDDLHFAPWFIPGNIQLLSLRKYRGYFKSYNPPTLPALPFHWSDNSPLESEEGNG